MANTELKSFVHFIGVINPMQYNNAVKVWGQPDFFHQWHDNRLYGDVGVNDVLVFGDKGYDEVNIYSWQDHALN